jgi:hypothetical protein
MGALTISTFPHYLFYMFQIVPNANYKIQIWLIVALTCGVSNQEKIKWDAGKT